MKMTWANSSKLVLASAGALALAAPLATAQSSRNPAPIVFKTPDAPQATATVQPQAGQGGPAAATPARPRIEFRYPDQPGYVYGDGEVRTATHDDPIVFSSSTSAISPEAARQYVNTSPPAPRPVDPAITTGGFDARATAARIAAQSGNTPASAAGLAEASSYSLPGQAYQPASVGAYDETGLASVYGEGFHGTPTANGETFDRGALMAAHPSLPLPSLVQVINLDTGREVVVRVNDRGPFEDGALIDLSQKAASDLGITPGRPAQVRLRYLGPAQVAAPQTRFVADTVAVTPSRPVTEFDLPGLEQVRPAPVAATSRVAPAAPTFSPAASATSSAQGYYVQVGSFSNIGNAERMSQSFTPGTNIEIVTARVNNADYFRVWIGPYNSRQQAQNARDDLSRRGVVNGLVISGQ